MAGYNAFSWALSQMSQSLHAVSSLKGQRYFVALRSLMDSRKVMILYFMWFFLAVKVGVTLSSSLHHRQKQKSQQFDSGVSVCFSCSRFVEFLGSVIFQCLPIQEIFRHFFKCFSACPLCASFMRLQSYVCQITHSTEVLIFFSTYASLWLGSLARFSISLLFCIV